MGGQPAGTRDQMPLEYAYGPDVMLDVRHMALETVMTAADVKSVFSEMDYQIKPLDIVLVMTGADQYWKEDDLPGYISDYAGTDREATLRVEMDEGKRRQIYRDIEKALYDNYADVWLWYPTGVTAVSRNLLGINTEYNSLGLEGFYHSHPVWLEDG